MVFVSLIIQAGFQLKQNGSVQHEMGVSTRIIFKSVTSYDLYSSFWKILQCKTDIKCAVSKFENDVCYILNDESPQLLKADEIYPGNLLVRIDLILQYVQRMNLQERFALPSIDDRILVIESQFNDTSTYDKWTIQCEDTKEYPSDIVPRHILDQMRFDSWMISNWWQ